MHLQIIHILNMIRTKKNEIVSVDIKVAFDIFKNLKKIMKMDSK